MKILSTFILSRHSLRRPLYEMIYFKDLIQNSNFRDFSNVKEELTEKGIEIEKLASKGLLDFLPNEIKDMKLYINDTLRTKNTAKILFESLFNEKIDPEKYIDSEAFYTFYNEEKEVSLNLNIDKNRLEDAKKALIDFSKKRNLDIFSKFDDLNKMSFKFKKNGFISLSGDISKYSKLADVILTEFYDGQDYELDFLEKIVYPKQLCLDIVSGTLPYSLRPLKKLSKIYDDTLKNDGTLSILVGHDSTINAFCSANNIDLSKLSRSIEKTPIGGKLVITKTEDLKKHVHYVYYDNISFDKIVVDYICDF